MEVSVNCGNTNIGELDYEKDIIAFGECYAKGGGFMKRRVLSLVTVLRRWTKGYTIKQPNMDCQPTEITALMRHRAVFS